MLQAQLRRPTLALTQTPQDCSVGGKHGVSEIGSTSSEGARPVIDSTTTFRLGDLRLISHLRKLGTANLVSLW